MVFVVGVLAAVFLGLGWVLQQRVAAHAARSELLSVRLLFHLMHKPVWWLGIASMITGAALGGLALQLGTVTLVEPLLSANLLFAFLIAALIARTRVTWTEVGGALLLSSALAVFIVVGDPRPGDSVDPSLRTGALAGGVVAGVVIVLVVLARRRGLLVESAIIATAAGLLYGVQDAATRAALLAADHDGIRGMLTTPWPYAVVASAAVGITLLQSAFGAARLDYSLPPTAAAEPVTGVALGVTVLGDSLSVSPVGIVVELICLLALVAGVLLIARSDSMAHSSGQHQDHHHIHVRQ